MPKIIQEKTIDTAIKMSREGKPLKEIGEKTKISKPKLIEIIRNAHKQSQEKPDATAIKESKTELDRIVEENRRVAAHIHKLMSDKNYGQIMRSVYADHGILLQSDPLVDIAELLDAYGDKETVLLAKKLIEGLQQHGITSENLTAKFIGDLVRLTKYSEADLGYLIDNSSYIWTLRGLKEAIMPWVKAMMKDGLTEQKAFYHIMINAYSKLNYEAIDKIIRE